MTVLRNAASSAGAATRLPITAPAWRDGAAPSTIRRPIRAASQSNPPNAQPIESIKLRRA